MFLRKKPKAFLDTQLYPKAIAWVVAFSAIAFLPLGSFAKAQNTIPATEIEDGQNWDGEKLYPGVSGNFDVPDPQNPAGSLVSCGDLYKNDGKSITGGTAGLQAGGNVCYSGGGSSFCADMPSFTYECAGVTITQGTDIDWRDFDIAEDEDEEIQEKYYGITTRDDHRGRAGSDIPLFMNAHGICRKVDNVDTNEKPLFLGVKTAGEWRTIHGVPEGGDPNGGYTTYADNPVVKAKMSVCCSPVILEICGQSVATGYAEVGETASVWGGNGHGTIQCVGNNDWRTVSVGGICGGGGDDKSLNPSKPGGGYYNPNNGGEISPDEWDKLDKAVKEVLEGQGYAEVTGGEAWNEMGYEYRQDTLSEDNAALIWKEDPVTGQKVEVQTSPAFVANENQAALADMEAAVELAAEIEAQKLEENLRLLEEQRRAAEEAERERQECIASGGTDCGAS